MLPRIKRKKLFDLAKQIKVVKDLDEDSKVGYRIGVWNANAQQESSNFRELGNLVETLEKLGENGELEGREIFLFTDNSTSELTYHKGNSESHLLFQWIVRLRRLNMKHLTRIHLIHVAGSRMISQVLTTCLVEKWLQE